MWNLYGVSLREAAQRDKVCFLDHYDYSVPPGLESAVINLSHFEGEEYRRVRREKLGPIIHKSIEQKENLFAYYDLNAMFSKLGKDFVTRFFAEETAKARMFGITMLVLCNFSEINDETISFLERISNGCIRTWVDGRYQYLQITKSPFGQMSEPMIVENIPILPYVKLM